MLVEIAADLGVSDQAVSERLRRAQTGIIGAVVAAGVE
jgi:predicted DNA binding protein